MADAFAQCRQAGSGGVLRSALGNGTCCSFLYKRRCCVVGLTNVQKNHGFAGVSKLIRHG